MTNSALESKTSKNKTGTLLVREALVANPNLPSRTIARQLFDEKANRGVWTNLDAVCQAVRYARGAQGKNSRNRKVFRAPPSPETTDRKQVFENEFYLPPSYESSFVPYYITVHGGLRMMVLSDLHIPYHNLRALQAALQEGKRRNVNCILLNGDILDFHQLSRFLTDPRKRNTKQEIEATRQFLEMLREAFPKAAIIFKEGNHDERYELYLFQHARELIGIAEHRLDVLLHLSDLGIDYVGSKRPVVAGHLSFLHGHEFRVPIAMPVNPARWLFLRAKECCMCGHFHQTSEHAENTLSDKTVAAWSTGCLSELHPAYMPINKWNHGAAYVEFHGDGTFEVENKKIIDGKIR
jgi:predicted phosphodiesterase